MDSCPSIPNPSTIKLPNEISESQLYFDLTNYRQLVGALQYLMFTHSNLSFSVNRLCQHMHLLLNLYFKQLKRVLRFIKASYFKRIHIHSIDLSLVAYNDFDYVGDTTDKKSIIGIAFFLAQSLFLGWLKSRLLLLDLQVK